MGVNMKDKVAAKQMHDTYWEEMNNGTHLDPKMLDDAANLCPHEQSDLQRDADRDTTSPEGIKVKVWVCQNCGCDIYWQGKDKDLVNGKPKLDA